MSRELETVELKWQGIFSNALPSGLGRFSSGIWDQSLAVEMPQSWADAEDRHTSVEEHARVGIAWQVRVNREERGLKQKDLAHLMQTGQSAVSKLEDPDGGDVKLSTLLNAARAFDCALLVRFVSYSEFAAVTRDLSSERLLACSYASECAPRTTWLADMTNSLGQVDG